ncbi:hypothetical protein BYT27DRAFT_7198534 [Phlegmacium glaucopus]|nr:hypothetical protein BYT27DRAFT_7198534 [Phlegmacium glaucopus]
MLRPPPLHLKFDNRFPNPVKSPKPVKSKTSFVSQLYKANWKNPIIAVAGLNALRFAFAYYNAFQDAAVDEMEEVDNLFMVSIALGAMYTIASVIEIYGVVSVSMQRLSVIRVYVYLALLATILIIGAGVLNGVSYFTFAEELLWECVSLATDGRGYQKSLFRGQHWPASVFPLTVRDARRQCVYAWVHQSWSQVSSVFLFSVFPAVISYALVYAYYQQATNPNHSACLINNDERRQHRSGSSGRLEASQVGYARVAGRDNNVGTTTNNDNDVSSRNGMTSSRMEHVHNLLSPRRRPTQVTKSLRDVGANTTSTGRQIGSTVNKKPPFVSKSLKRDRRPPPLIQSPSPIGLSLSPGPPTYGPSRVYAAFAAPVLSTECDKFI